MGAIVSQITSLAIVYSIVYSDADQRKHQSSASLASVHGIHRRPVNSSHKGAVTRKIFSFDDVIMIMIPDHNRHRNEKEERHQQFRYPTVMNDLQYIKNIIRRLYKYIIYIYTYKYICHRLAPVPHIDENAIRSPLSAYGLAPYATVSPISGQCSDITWPSWRLKSSATPLLLRQFVQAHINEVPRYYLGDRWNSTHERISNPKWVVMKDVFIRVFQLATFSITVLFTRWPKSNVHERCCDYVCHCLIFARARSPCGGCIRHYCDVIMGAMASRITSLTIVYSTVYSSAW